MIVVERQNTPHTLAELVAAVHQAFRVRRDRNPTREELEALGAQVAFETGGGRSSQNHAIGNIVATDKWTGQAWRPQWYEPPGPDTPAHVARLHFEMLAGRAPKAFRAYPSLAAAADDYLRVLTREVDRHGALKFGPILAAAALRPSDPARLTAAILGTNYTTGAKFADVERNLAHWLRVIRDEGHALAHGLQEPSDPGPGPSGADVAAILLAVGSLAAMVWGWRA